MYQQTFYGKLVIGNPQMLDYVVKDSDMQNNMDVPTNVSVITTEYFFTGVTHSLLSLKFNSREITVLASTLSVLAVMIIGSCIWCFTRFMRKRRKIETVSSAVSETSSYSGPESLFEGWNKSSSYEKKSAGAQTKKKMEISNGNKRKLMIHKNIITPDRHIEFVVPTISMPAQPSSSERRHSVSEPEASCSTRITKGQIPQQFYPQFSKVEEPSPQIGFSLYYEAATQILYVRLLGGQNFPENMRHCITVKLYPGRGGKQRTRESGEVMPIYNQEFCFHIRKSTLNTRILKIKAVIASTPKRVLGCINLALKELPGFEIEDVKEDLQSPQLWKRLDQPSDNSEGVKLQVLLKWTSDPPTSGLLTLRVIKASGIHETSDQDYTSTHVKVTLQEQGRSIKSRKTRLIRWGSMPDFDDVFVVTIPKELLSQISFILEVIARGRLGSKVVLGKISIGSVPFANPSTGGTDFWEDMCHQPDTEIIRWLQLLP